MAYSAIVDNTVGLVLFSLAAGDDDRGSAQDEHDASHVEDRGTDAAGKEYKKYIYSMLSLI